MGSEWTRKETNFESMAFVTTAGQILAPNEGQSFQRLIWPQVMKTQFSKGFVQCQLYAISAPDARVHLERLRGLGCGLLPCLAWSHGRGMGRTALGMSSSFLKAKEFQLMGIGECAG